MLERFDALRRSQRFARLLAVYAAVLEESARACERLQAARAAAAGAELGAALTAGVRGAAARDAVRRARLDAVRRALA